MVPKFWIVLGGILGATAVVAGAFGAHAFDDPKLSDYWYQQDFAAEEELAIEAGLWRKNMDLYETAARYHMYNAIAMVLAGILALTRKSLWAEVAGICFAAGFALFCVPLYALFFEGPRFLGAIAPIGGTAMIAGWLLLAVSAVRRGPQPTVADEESDEQGEAESS